MCFLRPRQVHLYAASIQMKLSWLQQLLVAETFLQPPLRLSHVLISPKKQLLVKDSVKNGTCLVIRIALVLECENQSMLCLLACLLSLCVYREYNGSN